MRNILRLFIVFLLLSPVNLYSQVTKDSFSSSVLSSGEWLKIAVTADGIYRIDFSMLRQKGFADPSNPRIFCNNNGQLSFYNDGSAADDLKEVAIYISGNDEIFGEGEYILFYGKSPHKWIYNEASHEYTFLRHNYSDTAFYFITSGPAPGKRIIPASEPAQAANYNSSQSDALFIHEVEYENILHTGRDWFQPIVSGTGIAIKPQFTDVVTSEKMLCSIRVAARAPNPTQFKLFEGGIQKKNIIVQGVNIYNYTGTWAQITDSIGSFLPESPSPEYLMRFYDDAQQGASGWIDFVKLQARVLNTFNGKLKQFSDNRSVAAGGITAFSIKSQLNDVIIWDISDEYNIKRVTYTKTGDNIAFKAENDLLRTFAAFTISNATFPYISAAPVPNQNLHGSASADMIIITHPWFTSYGQKLADIHLKNSGLISQVVTPQQIYNEFSGGIPDIAALRNFIRMKYLKQRGTPHPLRYLLLFGDGSFENKTPPPNNPNFVLTYQSKNSNVVISSFTSDDFYGLLEDGEGEAEGTEDIGIGRLPVSDTVQAGIILSKIKKYLDPASMGDWRNIICLTADDEDGNAHMSDAEGLNLTLKEKAPVFNVQKIYLDAFRQITNVNGQTYPDANKAINDRINSGCLIFNYTGHANETSLASESVVKMEDIRSWKNGGRLPLIITATCEFSRYDEGTVSMADRTITNKPSAGETALLNKDGGAIALMSTTRVVFSAPNFFLNRNIFSCAFDRDSSGNTMRLGDIIKVAKNNSGSGSNKRNFSLLGDPAVKLAYPWHGKVVTDSVNNVPVSGLIDSLKALSMITISGHLEDPEGIFMNNFNGIVSPIVYDKENKIRTYANDGGSVMEFYMRNSVLFSGKTRASNGRFTFSFIVPRDINYSFGNGKISYYAHNDIEDMNGSFSQIIVGGFLNASIDDSTGPVIKLYMNDTLFRSGGITDRNPVLLAILKDKGGINTSGSGIGHDLTGFLDKDRNNSFNLNNYFVNDFDDYRQGKITYYFTGLEEGSHSFTVKAWDNFNNSSEQTVLFVVYSGKSFLLKNLFNYPNPFLNETRITGELNRPYADLNVIVSIFNTAGKLVKIIRTSMPSTGYTLPPVTWDGNDDSGKRVARGIYPYSVSVSTETGETSRSSGRMIIL